MKKMRLQRLLWLLAILVVVAGYAVLSDAWQWGMIGIVDEKVGPDGLVLSFPHPDSFLSRGVFVHLASGEELVAVQSNVLLYVFSEHLYALRMPGGVTAWFVCTREVRPFGAVPESPFCSRLSIMPPALSTAFHKAHQILRRRMLAPGKEQGMFQLREATHRGRHSPRWFFLFSTSAVGPTFQPSRFDLDSDAFAAHIHEFLPIPLDFFSGQILPGQR